MVYGPRVRPSPPPLASSADVVPFLRAELGDSVVERFAVIAIDSRGRPQAWGVIAIGTVTHCAVSVAEIMRFVLLSGAPAFIVSHNHPSGAPSPSGDDIAMTREIVKAAKLLGLRCLDHVIVAEQGHVSFCDAGLLTDK